MLKKLLLLLTMAVAVHGQEPKHPASVKVETGNAPTAKCSTHSRQFKKPWTWFDSNMCDEDYQRWLAQRGPQKPFYKSAQWWIGETMIAGAMFADTWTTWHRPAGAVEENPILGTNPTPGEVGAVTAVGFGIETGLHIWAYNLTKTTPSATWRFIGHWECPVIVGVIAGNNAYNNFNTGYSPTINPGKPQELKIKPLWMSDLRRPH